MCQAAVRLMVHLPGVIVVRYFKNVRLIILALVQVRQRYSLAVLELWQLNVTSPVRMGRVGALMVVLIVRLWSVTYMIA